MDPTARDPGAWRSLPPDSRWLDFLYELTDIAARGGDVRQRIVAAY